VSAIHTSGRTNNSRGDFGRVFEVHRDLPDICEGVIPLVALEGRRGILVSPYKHRLVIFGLNISILTIIS
jgi:hypothetical protein